MDASASGAASHARAMLVEAAWAAAKAPGPLRAFFLRIRARRGHQVAAVAVARKLAMLCWHLLTKDADYQWARPALVANKLRAMELQAGATGEEGQQARRGLRLQRQSSCAIGKSTSRVTPNMPTSGSSATGSARPAKRRTGAANEERR